MNSDGLIDRVYECAFVPELWQDVIEEVAHRVAATGGLMYSADNAVSSWTCSRNMIGVMEVFAKGNFLKSSETANRNRSANYPGFRREVDFMTEAELAADPLIQDLLKPAGFGFGAGTIIEPPTPDKIVLNIQRGHDSGPLEKQGIEKLDMLRPHLARSMLIATRLHLERSRAALETLQALGLPAVVFGTSGAVIVANSLFEQLDNLIQWRARNRIAFADPAANVLFGDAVASLGNEPANHARSFAFKRSDERPAMIAHVIPVKRTARDIFDRALGVLILTPLTRAKAPQIDILQSLFDLTPAEARIARELTEGRNPIQIAQNTGVSINTVRTQLRGVLDKIGCSRQAEVVSMLSGISSPGQV